MNVGVACVMELVVVFCELVSVACAEGSSVVRNTLAALGVELRHGSPRDVCLECRLDEGANLSRLCRARPRLAAQAVLRGGEGGRLVDGHLLHEELAVRCHECQLLAILDVRVHLSVECALQLTPLELSDVLLASLCLRLHLRELSLELVCSSMSSWLLTLSDEGLQLLDGLDALTARRCQLLLGLLSLLEFAASGYEALRVVQLEVS